MSWSGEITGAKRDGSSILADFRFSHTDGRRIAQAAVRFHDASEAARRQYVRDKVGQLERDDAQRAHIQGIDPQSLIGPVDHTTPPPPGPTPEELALRAKQARIAAEVQEYRLCLRMVEMGLLRSDSPRLSDAFADVQASLQADRAIVEQLIGF